MLEVEKMWDMIVEWATAEGIVGQNISGMMYDCMSVIDPETQEQKIWEFDKVLKRITIK